MQSRRQAQCLADQAGSKSQRGLHNIYGVHPYIVAGSNNSALLGLLTSRPAQSKDLHELSTFSRQVLQNLEGITERKREGESEGRGRAGGGIFYRDCAALAGADWIAVRRGVVLVDSSLGAKLTKEWAEQSLQKPSPAYCGTDRLLDSHSILHSLISSFPDAKDFVPVSAEQQGWLKYGRLFPPVSV